MYNIFNSYVGGLFSVRGVTTSCGMFYSFITRIVYPHGGISSHIRVVKGHIGTRLLPQYRGYNTLARGIPNKSSRD